MTAVTAGDAARAAATPAVTKSVTLEIDGRSVTVPEGTSLWDAARGLGIEIPVLCHDPRLRPVGVCRMCVVEVEGARTLQASCVRPCEDGMKVRTSSPTVVRNRKMLTELLMADQRPQSAREATTGDDRLFGLARDLGADANRVAPGNGRRRDDSSLLASAPRLWIGESRLGRPHAHLVDGAVVARVDAPGAAGATVAFRLVQDGATLAELPPATVGADGSATASAPWSGPRWDDPAVAHPVLHLVATVDGGASRSTRLALAEPVADADHRLLVGGVPAYLAAFRLPGASGAEPRAGVAAFAVRVAAAGGNAVEVHGDAIPEAAWEALDELGLRVVATPRCHGALQRGGQTAPSPERVTFLATTLAGIAAGWQDHASLTVWTPEHDPSPQPTRARAAPNAVFLPSSTIAPLNPGDDTSRGFTPLPGYVNELPWDARSPELGERLGRFVARHVAQRGIGAVLPTAGLDDPLTGATYAATLRDALAAAGVAAWDAARPRYGPARVEVNATRAGTPAEGAVFTLEVPGLPPLGAVVDARGVARFEVDHAGPATVGPVEGARTELTLARGVYRGGEWLPSVVTAAVELPAAP